VSSNRLPEEGKLKKLTIGLFVGMIVVTLVVACAPPASGSGGTTGGTTGGGGNNNVQISPTPWPTKTPLPQRTTKPGGFGVPAGSDEDKTAEPASLPDLVLSSFNVRLQGFEGGCLPSLDVPAETYVCISNDGDGDADAFTVTLGDGEHEVDGLDAGDEECFAMETVGGELEIDPDNVIEEVDDDNNTEQIDTPTLTPPPVCTPTP
jgi:hypothetical protein